MLLMTPYYEFNLFELPKSFLNFQTEFYKKKCVYCKKERQDTVTCLLSGQTMCWYKIKDGPCKVQGQKNNEGLICHHTRVKEGGGSVFLHTSTGNFFLVQNGTASAFDGPYRSKYGVVVSSDEKQWDAFNIDQEGGGIAAVNLMAKQYSSFQLANTILSQRTNPDNKFKVIHKNAI